MPMGLGVPQIGTFLVQHLACLEGYEHEKAKLGGPSWLSAAHWYPRDLQAPMALQSSVSGPKPAALQSLFQLLAMCCSDSPHSPQLRGSHRLELTVSGAQNSVASYLSQEQPLSPFFYQHIPDPLAPTSL